jgi:NNMT/PNMT/TEMT family
MTQDGQTILDPGTTMTKKPAGPSLGKNADFRWDDFDSVAYLEHNYRSLRGDDQLILESVRDFFTRSKIAPGRRSLDVGSGTNLYPALAMLPFSENITLWEYSARNTRWLENEVKSYSTSWDPFWRLLAQLEPYRSLVNSRKLLANRAEVRQGSIFDLPQRQWDLGTMMFVAESLSTKEEEFVQASERFIHALRPGSPFAAAFMENSSGYDVGEQWFPAFAVTGETLRKTFHRLTTNLDIRRIAAPPEGLVRPGYTGMVLALGIVG